MTLPEVQELFDYWSEAPPEHELVALAVSAYTTWKPSETIRNAEEHRASLERRWKAGAMNAKQLLEAMGGKISVGGASDHPFSKLELPGIGPFPGIR